MQPSVVIQSTGSISYGPPGILFEDGFESGDFGKWTATYTTTGDDAAVVAVNPYQGNYHAQFQTDGTTSGVEWSISYYNISPEVNEIYARGYFYIADGLPLDDKTTVLPC